MEKLESNNFIENDNFIIETKIGMNGDISGFGKTLSMIGLILRDKMEWDLDTPFIFTKINTESNGRIKKYYTSRFEKLPTTLVVVSEIILNQWEKELKYSSLTYKKILCNKDIDDLKYDIKYDTILVLPSLYNNLVNKFDDYAWKRFIFDEPASASIKKMKEVHANFYWFITSKPNSILNKYRNVKGFIKDLLCSEDSIYDFETRFSDIIIRNDPEFVKQSFIMPKINSNYYSFIELKNTIDDFYHPVIKKLIEDDKIKNIIFYLRIPKIDPEIKKSLKNISVDDNPCPICLDKVNIPIIERNCNNIFCLKCFVLWIHKNNTCALCRNIIDIHKINYIDDYELPTILTKNDKILNIINGNVNTKILVYSKNIDNFYEIFKVLKEVVIESVKSFKKNIESFINDNDKKIIFISSKDNIVGIDIPGITDIIFFEDIDKHNEKDIISVANRIGRTSELNLHYF